MFIQLENTFETIIIYQSMSNGLHDKRMLSVASETIRNLKVWFYPKWMSGQVLNEYAPMKWLPKIEIFTI